VDCKSQTGREAQEGAGILGDIGLVKGKFGGHGRLLGPAASTGQWE
jgi:hypothetical protein